ncbi:MAG: glycosyltransferase family 4 protein [Actinomycetota bacterium]|nr:glycosyltransferase family 4 protein [Actinomycetota bacterium]
MRVTHLSPTLFGEHGLFGGGERYPHELARALSRYIHCTLVGFGSKPSRGVDETGLEMIVLRKFAHIKGHPAHPIATGIAAAIKRSDIVHTHHMKSLPSRVAAVVAHARNQRLAVTDHGLGAGGWGGFLPKLFDAFLEVSEYSARTLGAPPSKTRIIYGGADPERFFPDENTARSGALFVGRITPHKGLDRLLRALPQGVHLTIAGTVGHDRRSPERNYPSLVATLARDKSVALLGQIRDDDLPLLYRSASVLVLPSVHNTVYGRHVKISELLSLAAIEAMASGTPVVASSIGGLPEVVRDGETGYLVEPGDIQGLHDSVATLTRNPRLATKMGRAGRDLVLERFTWDRCARRCLVAYDELLSTGPA